MWRKGRRGEVHTQQPVILLWLSGSAVLVSFPLICYALEAQDITVEGRIMQASTQILCCIDLIPLLISYIQTSLFYRPA